MDYLTIMVTVLVLTQVIRVTQNAISLHRQEREVRRNVSWLKHNYAAEEDFENQREAFRLLREYLEHQNKGKEDEEDDVPILHDGRREEADEVGRI